MKKQTAISKDCRESGSSFFTVKTGSLEPEEAKTEILSLYTGNISYIKHGLKDELLVAAAFAAAKSIREAAS